MLREIGIVTALGLQSIPHRLGASLVVVTGVATVVAVFITVLSMANGFTKVAVSTGRADRAIVLAGGATTEAGSTLGRSEVVKILDGGGIRRSSGGEPVASAEALAFLPLVNRNTGKNTFVTVRGVGRENSALRTEIHIIEGRAFRPGSHEVVIGEAARRRLGSLSVGSPLALPQGQWTVVGVFTANGDSHESEILTDAETLLPAYRRQGFNSVTVALESESAFESFKTALGSDPTLSVEVMREDRFFAQSSQHVGQLILLIAFGVGGIMAFGASFGALNTMYSAVSTRGVEIATLRALGFSPIAVVTSVLFEALLLAFAGAAIGALAVWVLFEGTTVNTLTGTSPSQLTFALRVTPGTVALGVIGACIIGMVGGLLPAIRAGGVSIVDAMRAT